MKKSITDPNGATYEYAYDEGNRLRAMLVPGAGPISYNAYQWNSPVKMTLPDGGTTEYTYDPLMQVKAILAKDPGQNQVVTRQYQYSAAGNISSKDTEHGSYTYQYDALYRLTQADNPTLPDEAYTYDALGNRLTAAGNPGQWSYNANNELLGYGSKTFSYDLNGNMTGKADAGLQTTYIYDVEDRLVRVESGASSLIAEYYYDPFGRRLWKDVDGARTYFVYCDEGLVGEYDASGAELRTYGWAPQSQWGTDPFFVKIGSQYYWYQNDHQGTPQKLITSSGQVVWAATYESFANARVDVEAITNNLRFPGQYYDAETGLHYNLNRYYDPATGRYLRTDPYGEGLNLYAYCFHNPLSLIDPLGLCAAKYIGIQFYYSLWHFADQFNRLVFFPLLDIFAFPERLLDWITPTTSEERMAWAATFPAPMFADDILIGGIAVAGKLPRFARVITGYSSAIAKTGVKAFEVVEYGVKTPGFVKHHGVLDVWASYNVPRYISRGPKTPAVVLTTEQHKATNKVLETWAREKYGKPIGAKIEWTQVSPQEAQALTEQMFRAAGVPSEVRREYYRAFHQHIYGAN